MCGSAQQYYERTNSKTQVVPASLTSIEEVMKLAGARNITVSPPLLLGLAETSADSWEGDTGSVFKGRSEEDFENFNGILDDESSWRLAFTRCQNGLAEGKIIQAINIFCDKQDGLEQLARRHMTPR
jgi:transaldolase